MASELDRVNGLNFLFKRYDTLLGDFITRMEVGSLLISHFLIYSQTSAITVINSHITFPRRN